MYSIAHVKGKCYTCFLQGSCTIHVCILHAGALQATQLCVWQSTHVCSQYLCMFNFSERAIVETKLRVDRKIEEANVGDSETNFAYMCM